MRPLIIYHMVTSIDGRLHPSRFTSAATGISAEVLLGHYEEVARRFGADGWIVGRKTMSELIDARERPPDAVSADAVSAIIREPYLGDRNGRNLAITIDPLGHIHYGQDNIDGDHIVTVLGEQVSDAYLAELRADGVSYLFAGSNGGDLHGAMAQLAAIFGVKKLLLEGGGKINGAFFKHRLVDEFSTLIYPGVDGLAGVPSIVDYDGADGEHPGAGQSLRLIGCETLKGGMVWLHHAVEDAPGALLR